MDTGQYVLSSFVVSGISFLFLAGQNAPLKWSYELRAPFIDKVFRFISASAGPLPSHCATTAPHEFLPDK